ncbi:hypothetical protein B0H12DRAFT_1086722 [Mycena haematopus]|nr:hypothetical protein B0H12DRAFT_1086722 [Mycena haematopus]
MARQTLPFNSHHGTDEPLYAVVDSPLVSTPSVPPLEMPIASERISLRTDGVSGFFKALCQRYRPLVREAFVDNSEAEDVAVVPPTFPVNWRRKFNRVPPKQTTLLPKDEASGSMLAKGDPLEPPSVLQEFFQVPKDEQIVPRPKAEPKPLPEKLCGGVLQEAIYKPHGKWAYAAGLPFRESEPSLALYKLQLKSLQGRVVPTIINVYSCLGAVDVAMEPPHHSFWIEASADMPHVLKKRCVEAFEKLHSAGVLHGDIELRHMLFGGDARVTIIDFQASRALEPNPEVGLAAATPDELRLEMRKVKFKLDYEDARAREDEKLMRAARLARRNQKGRTLEEPLPEDVVDPPIDSRVWNLEWVGAPVNPTRFIMPGQSAEDIERAVEDFLDVLELLEKERTHQDGPRARRRASPDFKPPAVVPAKSSGMPGRGFGATVVTPGRPQRPPSDLKSSVVIPSKPSGAPTVTATALKRKGDCDHSQEDRKRIRVDFITTSALRSPPLSHETFPPTFLAHPFPTLKIRDAACGKPIRLPRQSNVTPAPTPAPFIADTSTTSSTSYSPPRVLEGLVPIVSHPLPTLKVRDFAYEMRLRRSPSLTPPAPHLDPSFSSSSAKRKRAADASDESLETRGQPRMRLSSNISNFSCDHTISDVVKGAADVSSAVHDAKGVTTVQEPKDNVYVPYPLFPTPLLSIRFVENIWRMVS